MLTTKECQEIRERADKATKGPWAQNADDASAIEHEYGLFYWQLSAHVDESHNASFIAHARTDIPALLDTVDELRAKLADLAEWCAELEHCAQEQLR